MTRSQTLLLTLFTLATVPVTGQNSQPSGSTAPSPVIPQSAPVALSVNSADTAVADDIDKIARLVLLAQKNGQPGEQQIGANAILGIDAAKVIQAPQLAANAEHFFKAAVATTQLKKQVGSPSTASGTTTLSQKAGIQDLLGIAVENGAVQEDVNGNTLTLRTSGYAPLAAFSGDSDQTYQQYGAFARIGAFASFNVTNSGDPLQDATRKQLSSAGGSFRVFGNPSTRSKAVRDRWNRMASIQQAAVDTRSSLLDEWGTPGSPMLVAWNQFVADAQVAVKAYLANPPATDSDDAAKATSIAALIKKAFDADFATKINAAGYFSDARLTAYQDALNTFAREFKSFQTAVPDIVNAPIGSIIYTDQVQTGASNYSNVAFAYSGHPKGFGDLTVNVSSSFYTKPNATLNQHTFRDAAVSFNLEGKIKRSPLVRDAADQSSVSVSLSGRYERLQENQHMSSKKADIGEGNFKLEIPLGGGMSLPLSATFANAGQTIKESYIRGNFGLSFDLDKLASLLNH